MSDKPRVKFLTVIWGKRYIDEFSRVSLPSFLAPGNLPHLAQSSDLEVLIMTSEKSPPIFEKERAFRILRSLCRVRFIFIDDLITTGVYGVTLTLAYARGIRDSGADQTDTYFVFMNSDFVLADGSLRTLHEKMAEGNPCIMAPSLRACAEATVPALRRSVDHTSGSLAIPPRRLVRVAFEHLHPTVVGKTISQDFMECTTHNQIYWQVDSTTLLGRYHLIFMLAIKPERPMPPVNSYCDYGFVPELVPSGRFTVLDDSDNFFMLELQPEDQEHQDLRCGTSRIGEIAKELSRWTTREHRRFAEVDVVFHAGDLPPNLATIRAEAASFMSRLRRKMKRKPVDHVRHFYWVFGVEAWRVRRQVEMGLETAIPLPPECGPLYASRGLFSLVAFRTAYLAILGRLRRLASVKPHVPVWHHEWLDSRLVLGWIADVNASQERRNLLVAPSDSTLARSLGSIGDFDIIRTSDLTDANALAEWLNGAGGRAPYSSALCHIPRSDVRKIRKLLERLTSLLDRDAVVGVYVDHEQGDIAYGNLTTELAQQVDDILPAGWTGLQIKAKFAGGRAKRRLLLLERWLIRNLWPNTWKKALLLPLVTLAWPAVATLTAINNWRLRNGYDTCPAFCSSVLLCLTQIASNDAASAESDVAPSKAQQINYATRGLGSQGAP
ncbi:MAG TPA: hypothetical protein VKY65_07970 [Alphaproteobacteria bacterium]|nr:hypothetical protein [Alphaproteobacteria bacterium]